MDRSAVAARRQIASTLPVALSLAVAIYVLIMLRLGWRWLSYGAMAIVTLACIKSGTVHFAYIGIEMACLGFLMTYADPLRFVRLAKAKPVEKV